MFKAILNLVLSIILGSLKPVLLKHIEEANIESLSNPEKRQIVFNSIKQDLANARKSIRDSLINLAIEMGVNLLKERLK